MKRLLLLVFFLTPALAVPTQQQGWFNITLTRNSPKFEYYFQYQPRYSFNQNHFQQIVYRWAGELKVTPKDRMGLAYTYFSLYQTVPNDENRIWQIWDHIFLDNTAWLLVTRTILEERMIQFESAVNIRWRERAALTLKSVSFLHGHPTFYNEIFINLNNPLWVGTQTVAQNRVFAGLTYSLPKDQEFIIGYINQAQFAAHSTLYTNIVYLSYENNF